MFIIRIFRRGILSSSAKISLFHISHIFLFIILFKYQVAIDFLPFGSVDVKLRSNKEAIIAVSHRKRY